ncbi:MATE family efflux transporter [Chloroflexota bacterium]
MEETEKVGGFGRGGRGGSRFDRDWTKGSVIANLWSLGWPMLATQSLQQVGPFVDMIWVARLGVASIAGMGVASLVVRLSVGFKVGLVTGMRAIVARFVGTKDTEGANHVAQQAFVISAVFSIIMAAIGIFLTEPILILFGLEADVVAQGAAYMRILFVGGAAMSFRTMAEGVMQASGDAITPMRISIFYKLFHVVLAPFLIFGWWLFPRLGISGAALTDVVAQSLGLALMFWFLFSGRTRLRLTLRNFRLDGNIIWRILKIGLPASVVQMETQLYHIVLMRIIVPFGTLAVAARSLFLRIQIPLLVAPTSTLGKAGGILAAQNLGAGQPERAERTGWLAAGFTETLVLIICLVLLLWAERIIGIFTSEPGVVEIASTWLRIATVGFLALGLSQVLGNCISDSGDTVPRIFLDLIGMWVIGVPLAYFVPRVTNLGVYGVQWGIVIGQIARAVAHITYFKLGRWKRKRV